MRDKLCVSERRTKILEFLVKKKQSTRCELATEFNVSTDTIDRDIVYLSFCEHWSDVKIGSHFKMSRSAVQRLKRKLHGELKEKLTGGRNEDK